jgi:UDP-GlcNAc:undecaprenyl-phosphate GlcNAc-1-phosphate transferase
MSICLSELAVLFVGLIFSFGITFFGIPSVIKIARKKELYDEPGDRTSHIEPTPRLGGAMIFAGVILSSVLFTNLDTAFRLKYIIAGMLILFFIGIKDDIISLSPFKKAFGQLFASLIIVIPGNIRVTDFYGLFGINNPGIILSVLVTLFMLMFLINSMNLIDGIDGLASGIGIVGSVVFGTWFSLNNEFSYGVMCFSLTGSLLAFFWYNVFSKSYKIFLGDTGSMLIGFLLMVFAIQFLKMNENNLSNLRISIAPSLTFAILIIPVFDTLRIILIRVLNKRPISKGDHNHLHHKILNISNSHLKATFSILIVNILLIVLTYLFRNLGNTVLISSLFLISTIFFLFLYLYHKKE